MTAAPLPPAGSRPAAEPLQAGPFVQKVPPSHVTLQDFHETRKYGIPTRCVPSSERPLHVTHAGYAGWDIPTPAALDYAANVICEHAETIRALLLPRLAPQDRSEWIITLRVCEWLRELMYEPDFQFPVRFPLAGFVRFRDWDEVSLQWQVLSMCARSEEALREIFLTPHSDPLSALEWAEVLKFSDLIHQRQSGGNEKSTLKPSLDSLLNEVALRAHTERGNYVLRNNGEALVRLELAPQVAA